MTQAQIKFLDRVLQSGGHTNCANIGEFRAREACLRNGYLERDHVERGIILMRLTDKAREELRKLAEAAA